MSAPTHAEVTKAYGGHGWVLDYWCEGAPYMHEEWFDTWREAVDRAFEVTA